jgi:hypothetical protein
MASIKVTATHTNAPVTIGTRTTPFTIEESELVNDYTTHAALVIAVNDGTVLAVENGHPCRPAEISNKSFNGKPGFSKWIETPPLAYGRISGALCALTNNQALMIGGLTLWTGPTAPMSDLLTVRNHLATAIEIWDSKYNQWINIGSLGTGRFNSILQPIKPSSIYPQGGALVFGGTGPGTEVPVVNDFFGLRPIVNGSPLTIRTSPNHLFRTGSAETGGSVGATATIGFFLTGGGYSTLVTTITGVGADGLTIQIAESAPSNSTGVVDLKVTYPACIGNYANPNTAIFNNAQGRLEPMAPLPAGFCPSPDAGRNSCVIQGGIYDGHILVHGGAGWTNEPWGASELSENPPPNASRGTYPHDWVENSSVTYRFEPPSDANPWGAWHVCASINFGDNKRTLVAIGNGKVMALGGFNLDILGRITDTAARCLIYNSQADAWSVVAPMPGAFYDESVGGDTSHGGRTYSFPALLVQNGTKVLIIGGKAQPLNQMTHARRSLALYDIASNTWQDLVGDEQVMLKTRMACFPAYLLPNNDVLVAGGLMLDPVTGVGSLDTNPLTEAISTNTYKVRVTKDLSTVPLLNASRNNQHCQLTNGDILYCGGCAGPLNIDTEIQGTCTNTSVLWKAGIIPK